MPVVHPHDRRKSQLSNGIPKDVHDKLFETLNTDGVPVIDASGLMAHLVNLEPISKLIVHDVGQGNAVGLYAKGNKLLGFIDCGRGVKQNAKTYSNKKLDEITLTNDQFVLLTHWDKDHWALGAWLDSGCNSKWFAPKQRVGPEGAAFIHHLLRNGRLHYIESDKNILKFGENIEIRQCNGFDKNNSGFSYLVKSDLKRVLLPGDASYSSIPWDVSDSPLRFHAVVAPHHGGICGMDVSVHPEAQGDSKLIYSVGRKNSFKHPRDVTIKFHERHGWSVRQENSVTLSTAGGNLGSQNDIIVDL